MVYPKSNAPQEMQPWVKQIQNDVENLKGGQSRIEGNFSKQISGASSAAQSAADTASSAQSTATNTEQQQTAAKQIDSSNLFDLTPLALKDASGWETWAATRDASAYVNRRQEIPNITSWYEDGFEITALEAGYVEIRNKERYRNTGPVFPTAQVQVIRDNATWGSGQDVSIRAVAFDASSVEISGGYNSGSGAGYEPPRYLLTYGAYEPGYNNVVRDALMSRQDFVNRPAFNNPQKRFAGSVNGVDTYDNVPVATWVPSFSISFTAAGQKAQIRGLKMQQISPDAGVIGQPGVNLFDVRPIVEQNTIYWDMQDSVGGISAWYSNGFQIPTPFWNGTLRSNIIYTRKIAGVKAGQVLSMSVNLGFSTTQAGAETSGIGLAGFGYSWFTDDGTPTSVAGTGGYTDQNGVYSTSVVVPPGATSVRINLFAYVPSNYPNPQSQIWVKFRDIYFGLQVNNQGYQRQSITQDKLDPSITFGVADNSLTTAKYQDASVTNVKIAGPVDASKIGTGYPIANTTGNLPATRLTGPILNSQIGGAQVDTPQLTTNVTSKLVNTGSFRNIYNDPDLANGYQSIPNNTWTQMPLQTLTSEYTRKNTLNDGSAASISGNYIVAPKTGRYLVNIAVRFSPNSSGTARGVAAQVNTGPRQMENNMRVPGNASLPSFAIPMTCTAEVEANAGDTIRPAVTQNSGAALNVRLETFTVSYLGPA